jgi:hypothetical protein
MSKIILGVLLIVCAASADAQGLRQPAFTIINGANTRLDTAAGTAATVTLPVLTFILDDTHQIRPVFGVPGSASIGAALNLGFQVLDAAIPAGHDYILAITRESNWPVLLQVRGNTITIRSLDVFAKPSLTRERECEVPEDASFSVASRLRRSTCRPDPSTTDQNAKIERIALSPTGSTAAFFSEQERRIYSFANLSQSPVLLGSFNVDAPGVLSTFAINDSGSVVGFGLSDGNTGALFLRHVNDRAATNRFIASVHDVSVIKFLHHSDSVIMADRLDNAVYAVSNGQLFTVAAAEHGISRPLGIAVSNDNQKIFVANSAAGTVTAIGPAGAVAESKSCDCSLTGLHATNADSVFRLTDFSRSPILMFDGSVAAPRITILPLSSVF